MDDLRPFACRLAKVFGEVKAKYASELPLRSLAGPLEALSLLQ